MTPSASRPPRLADLISRATAADGSPPFSDGALVDLANGERELLWLDDAAALVAPGEAEFVVDPDARGRGQGTRMLEALTTAHAAPNERRLFWAHGDHPAARALAASHGLRLVRELLHLEAPVPSLPEILEVLEVLEGSGTVHEVASRASVTAYTPADADAWVALNARAFAAHAEQGAVTRADLDVLTAEPWFDPGDFLLLRDGSELIGYSWMKTADGEGEFYVVGVSPGRQGQGLGRRLVAAGLARLASRGIRTAHLYVEGDNAPALALYRGFGFTRRSTDVQYLWQAPG